MGFFKVVLPKMYLRLLYLLVVIGREQAFSQSLAPHNTYKEVLDPFTGLALEWRVDRSSGVILMTIEADKVSGAIVLGLTRRGQLEGADVMVCGIKEDGTPYIHDMHGVTNDSVAQDDNQDWELISGERFSSGRTVIRIQRIMDTCDEQDLPISSELIYVIWKMRESHDCPTSLQLEGVKRIFFQDSFILPQSYKNADIGKETVSEWRVRRSYRMPNIAPTRHTSYWCSIHKSPSLLAKHHIVGFKAYLQDEKARRHIHHQILYRCTAPQGSDPVALFEPFVTHPGEECFLNTDPKLPIPYCREIVYVDSVGSEPSKIPAQVGIPIGESPNEYFLLEGHYDNQGLDEIEVESGVDLEYSPNLRENDGSIIFVGHGLLGTFIQPPRTSQFNVVGHCSKDCTANMLPPTGIEILGIAPHAHKSIQTIQLRHFREEKELANIISDMQFDVNFQQLRMLEIPALILPGDQLTMQCGYDNRWANGSATISGFSTKQEKCIAYLLLNQRLPYTMCTSAYPEDELLNRFGIHNVTWNGNLIERVIDSSDNPDLIDLSLSQAVERFTEWTPERVAELEGAQMFGKHRAACPNIRDISASASRQLGQSDSGESDRTQDQASQDESELPSVCLPNVPEYTEPTICPQKSDMEVLESSPRAVIPISSQRITLRRAGAQGARPSLPTRPGESGARLPLFRLRVNRVD